MLKKKDEEVAHVELLIKMQDHDALVRVLADPEAKGACAKLALDALIVADKAECWDAIGTMLASTMTGATELVMQRLAELATPGAVRALGESLSNRNVFVRSAAVRALVQINVPAILAHLLRAARDPEPNLARMASRSILRVIERRPALLGEIRENTAEGIFDLLDDRWSMELLSDTFPENIRIMAAQRLGGIGGDEATQSLVSMVQSTTGKLAEVCWRSLEACRSVTGFVLLPLLVSPDPEVKARAIGVYAEFSDSEAQDLLAGLAVDANPKVRIAALKGIAKVAAVGAIPTLEAALDDKEEEIQLLAIDLLCQIDDSTPEVLRAALRFGGEVRRKSLVCLANRGVITSDLVMLYVEFLYKGAACTDLSQRDYLDSLAAVARTLGDSQDLNALLALTALARSVIRRLRRASIEGIMKYSPDDRSDALFSLLDTHDSDILKNIAFGLHENKDPRAVVPLVRTFIEGRGKTMLRAKESLQEYEQISNIDFLIECLSSRFASVRRYGAQRLRHIKDEKAIPALLVASRDEDVEVQLAVFEAMGPFAAEKDDVTQRMLEAISYGDISVRQTVCESLGDARCVAAVPELIRALHNYFLRPRASDALKRIGDRKGYLAMKRIERREKLFAKKPQGDTPGVKKKKSAGAH